MRIREQAKMLLVLATLVVVALLVFFVPFGTSSALAWEESLLRQEFLVRSLMDTLPVLEDSMMTTNNRNGSVPQLLLYPAAHTDDNVVSLVDGVEDVVSFLVTHRHADAPISIAVHEVDNARLHPPIPHFSGTALTYRLLQERSLLQKHSHVQYIPGWHDEYTGMNSLNEMEGLIRYCREQNITTLIVVSLPFHLPRCFWSALSVASRLYPQLDIYAQAASPPRDPHYWNHVVAHSQGILVGARHDLIRSELQRIVQYTKQGDLIPVAQALEILQARDQGKSLPS